jgi:hypothetical protein
LFVLEWTVNELGLMHCGANAWMDDFHAVRIGDSERAREWKKEKEEQGRSWNLSLTQFDS